jgi:sodium transport system permease protein
VHNILTILQKELRDTLRDRRTLIVMIIVPIFLMPALFGAVGRISSSSATQTSTVALTGRASAPALIGRLQADPKLVLRFENDPAAAVRSQRADVGIVVPPGFQARVAAGRSAPLQLVQNTTRSGSSGAAARLQTDIAAYSAGVVATRLQARGLSSGILAPVLVGQVDVSTKEERGGLLLSFILPLFVIIYAITGGMYTAMDVSAGEKERSTLEALLLTPATRLEITLGKLLAVSVVAFITIVAAMSSMVYSLAHFPIATGNGGFTARLDPSVAPLVFVLGILLALAFAALELALGILARSFKEAQSYITPLYLISFVPVAIINSIPSFQPAPALFLVPPLNGVLLFKEALLGHADALHAALTLASLLLFAAVSVAITVNMFTREKVLLKT